MTMKPWADLVELIRQNPDYSLREDYLETWLANPAWPVRREAVFALWTLRTQISHSILILLLQRVELEVGAADERSCDPDMWAPGDEGVFGEIGIPICQIILWLSILANDDTTKCNANEWVQKNKEHPLFKGFLRSLAESQWYGITELEDLQDRTIVHVRNRKDNPNQKLVSFQYALLKKAKSSPCIIDDGGSGMLDGFWTPTLYFEEIKGASMAQFPAGGMMLRIAKEDELTRAGKPRRFSYNNVLW